MSSAIDRQKKELLSEMEDFIEELGMKKRPANNPEGQALAALKRAYVTLADEWTRNAAEVAVYFLDSCMVKQRGEDPLLLERMSRLARKIERIGQNLNR